MLWFLTLIFHGKDHCSLEKMADSISGEDRHEVNHSIMLCQEKTKQQHNTTQHNTRKTSKTTLLQSHGMCLRIVTAAEEETSKSHKE